MVGWCGKAGEGGGRHRGGCGCGRGRDGKVIFEFFRTRIVVVGGGWCCTKSLYKPSDSRT